MLNMAIRHGRLAHRGLLDAKFRQGKHVVSIRLRSLQVVPKRRMRQVISANLTSKGRRHSASSLTVKRIMGEGSFGQVFEGMLDDGNGPQRVVVKRVKARVLGAEEMGQAEHLLNVYASKVAKGHCADFLGYCEVADQEATPKLTAGLWLVWKYQGSKTLSYYLRRRDTIQSLSRDMGVPQENVVPTVMKHIFTAIHAFHACGLVHRDIKPLNIIFSEEERRFKLIDLGACADLRNGTNYKPDESILDPNYCPPEQYVLPTDAPHLASSPFSMAISPMLWALHKPDRFDSWSAGLVLMQLCVPSLRGDRGLKLFNTALQRADYDLQRWRLAANLRKTETQLLDAFDGAGWSLAQGLLRPRRIVYDEQTGDVAFVNDGSVQRMSMGEALRHPLLKQAREPQVEPELAAADAATAAAPGAAPGNVFSNAVGAWRSLTNRLFDLEAQLIVTASATQQATATLKRLKEAKASVKEVKAAEAKVGLMRDQMGQLEQELVSTSAKAQGLLSFLGFNKPKTEPLANPAGLPPAQPAAARAGSWGGKKGSASGRPKRDPVVADLENSPKSQDVWGRMANQLLRLEDMITNMTTATEQQTMTVKRLQRDVQLGNAEPSLLAKAERVLGRMQRRVDKLQTEYSELSSEAADILRRANSGSTKDKLRAPSGSGSSGVSTEASKPGSWWNRTPPPPVPPEAPAATSSMDEAVAAAKADNSLLTAGMRFTSMMVRMAGDVANLVEKDAQEKKLARAVDAAFVELLRERGVAFTAPFQETAAALAAEPRWTAVEDKRRPMLFQAYQAAARKQAVEARQQAEARLKALYLRVGVNAASTWNQLRPRVAVDAAFAAVADEARRLAVFEQLVAEARQQEALLRQREVQEDDFRRLLTESKLGITPASRWALVKQSLWNDPRYTVLTERRRQALFDEYKEALATQAPPAPPAPQQEQQQQQPATPAAPAAAAAAPAAAAPAAAAAAAAAAPRGVEEAAPVTLPDLEQLLQQQVMLRAEYQRMEAKLREMEAKLKERGQLPEGTTTPAPSSTPTPDAPAAPPATEALQHAAAAGDLPLSLPSHLQLSPTASWEEADDGSMVFQFGQNGTKPLQTASSSNSSKAA